MPSAAELVCSRFVDDLAVGEIAALLARLPEGLGITMKGDWLLDEIRQPQQLRNQERVTPLSQHDIRVIFPQDLIQSLNDLLVASGLNNASFAVDLQLQLSTPAERVPGIDGEVLKAQGENPKIGERVFPIPGIVERTNALQAVFAINAELAVSKWEQVPLEEVHLFQGKVAIEDLYSPIQLACKLFDDLREERWRVNPHFQHRLPPTGQQIQSLRGRR